MKAIHPAMRTISAALGTVLVFSAGAALAQSGPRMTNGVLADPSGMTVYTFDKDTAGSGKSVCNDQCAKMWPPVPANAKVMEPYSVVTRDDGGKQLAYKGKPLYMFANDTKAGERKGDKMKDVWHVVTD